MASELTDSAALAVVIARLGDLQEEMKGLRKQFTDQASSHVGRGEWVQRNDNVDTRFRSQGREIADLRTDLHSKRLPWTQVLSAIVSVAALLVALGVVGP